MVTGEDFAFFRWQSLRWPGLVGVMCTPMDTARIDWWAWSRYCQYIWRHCPR